MPHGWKPIDVQGLLNAAAQSNRLSFWMRLLAKLPNQRGNRARGPGEASACSSGPEQASFIRINKKPMVRTS